MYTLPSIARRASSRSRARRRISATVIPDACRRTLVFAIAVGDRDAAAGGNPQQISEPERAEVQNARHERTVAQGNDRVDGLVKSWVAGGRARKATAWSRRRATSVSSSSNVAALAALPRESAAASAACAASRRHGGRRRLPGASHRAPARECAPAPPASPHLVFAQVAKAHRLAARGDGLQERARALRGEHDEFSGRRLLEHLEEAVGRLRGHAFGVRDHEHLDLRLDRGDPRLKARLTAPAPFADPGRDRWRWRRSPCR